MTTKELGQKVDSLLSEMRQIRILMEHEVLPNYWWQHRNCPVCADMRGISDPNWGKIQKAATGISKVK